jgi:hypothetical protein
MGRRIICWGRISLKVGRMMPFWRTRTIAEITGWNNSSRHSPRVMFRYSSTDCVLSI